MLNYKKKKKKRKKKTIIKTSTCVNMLHKQKDYQRNICQRKVVTPPCTPPCHLLQISSQGFVSVFLVPSIPKSLSGATRFLTQSRYIPDPRPLYTFRPIDVDSGFPNPVRTCPLPDKPVAVERPSRLIIFLFYPSYDFLIIRPLYYLLFPISPYLGL